MNGFIGVILKASFEILKGKLFSLGWKVLFERMLTRLLIVCLIKLDKLSTNTFVKGTAGDFLKELQGHGLPEAILPEDTER